MPACFQLYVKDRPGEGPVLLNKIDEEMCAHFGVPVDPVKYMHRWFDSIGFRLAMGKSFDEIRLEFQKILEEEKLRQDGDVPEITTTLQILDWLAERYDPNSFHSRVKD